MTSKNIRSGSGRRPACRAVLAAALVAGALGVAGGAWAQAPVPFPQPPLGNPTGATVAPFAMTGYIESLTLDAGTDPTRGGKVVVNGTEVIIPKNTIIVLPAQQLLLNDLVFLNAQVGGNPGE